MKLYPAIDLRGGRCVRLYQGDYDRETHYGDDPVSQARQFADAGAPWIHVVDLDGARKVLRLVDALEDSDDVQDVYTNVDIPDDVAAQLDED